MITTTSGAIQVVPASVQSPALLATSRRAYELKFLIDIDLARVVREWASTKLTADPHGDPRLHGAYDTTTLYFDTPELDVHLRSRWYRRRKLRVRRYRQESWVCLEQKSRQGDRVAKRRTVMSLADLQRLHDTAGLTQPTVESEWFARLMRAKRLRPAAQVVYRRWAFIGQSAASPMRLTLDDDIRGVVLDGAWELTPAQRARALLPERLILELKFLDSMPAVFKELIHEHALQPAILSKYRACRTPCCLTPDGLKERS